MSPPRQPHRAIGRERQDGQANAAGADYGILGLLRSEWTKLRSVRSTMWTLGITIVLGISVSALATAETRAHWLTTSDANRQGFDPVEYKPHRRVHRTIRGIGILGVLVMSGEYGTGTIRATLSAAPRRPLVLLAKVIVFGVVALGTAEIVSFLARSSSARRCSLRRHRMQRSGVPGAWRAVVGSGLYVGVLGLFFAWTLRAQSSVTPREQSARLSASFLCSP